MANNHPAGLRLKEALRWLKTKKNMEQKDVAVTMGTSETTVSRNIRAALDGRPNADFILKLSEATGVSFNLQYIVNGTGTLLAQQEKAEPTLASPATDNILELHAQMIRRVDDLRQELHQELLAVRELKDELRDTLAELKSATTYEYGMAAETLDEH
jgi:transcriptional regulator with XRE-family HTH domain